MRTRTTMASKKSSRDNHVSPRREEVAPSAAFSTGWLPGLKDPIFQIFALGFLIVALGLWWRIGHLQQQLAETFASDQARSYALSLKNMDSAYRVVADGQGQAAGEASAQDSKKRGNPLPSFSDLLAMASKGPLGMQGRFYNLEPAPGQIASSSVPDEFIREAWESVGGSPDASLMQVEEFLGEQTLRYAISWAEQTGKGVLEIDVPLSSVMAASKTYGNTVLDLLLGLGLLSVCVMVVGLGKARRKTQISEQRVAILESECAKQEKMLRSYERDKNDRKQHEAAILCAVEVLASVTKGLQNTSGELTASAAEMAAAVTETTTAVEEVKQTAALSSQKASQVAASAREAAQTSQVGQQATEETITEMQRIRDQMQAIAESIVHLSEQSHAIREIIDTVNDLAEQSNVLAVNASIEAQKAGAHGSGFATVAQEVRSLAQQSKDATAQVQAILNDIEKATGSAVQMTARGAKTTEVGMTQAVEACESIRVLARNIQESAQNASFIATSNQQQAVGMDQLAQAMLSIQEGSEHTVFSSRQVEGCAMQLKELEQQLTTLGKQLAGISMDVLLTGTESVVEAA